MEIFFSNDHISSKDHKNVKVQENSCMNSKVENVQKLFFVF